MRLSFGVAALSVMLGGCAGLRGDAPRVGPASAPGATQVTGAAGSTGANAESAAGLAAEYWELRLRSAPRFATTVGDHRYDAALEDLSPAALGSKRAALRALLDRVGRVTARQASERVIRDALIETLGAELGRAVCQFEFWRLDQLEGLQTSLAELPSLHPTDTRARAKALVARYEKIPGLLRQYQANLRVGLAKGWVSPKVVVERVLKQVDTLVAAEPKASVFVPRRQGFAADVLVSEQDALHAAVIAAIGARVTPALAGFAVFLRREVLPKARTEPGIWALPFGPACYAAELRHHTSLSLSPQELHRLGWSEVDRIVGELRMLAKKHGFVTKTGAGDPAAYAAAVAKDQKQRVASREVLLATHQGTLARALEALPRLFGRLPKTPVEVKAIESYREQDSPAGYYYAAPKDRSRPGLFYLNTFGAEKETLSGGEALNFHEVVPGHHLQMALAQELGARVPAFLREDGSSAFVEGWALYAERVADELGLYSSGAGQLARLHSELWRALRLVADTGLHSLGWSREQTIDAMVAPTGERRDRAAAEVDRYIAWPGQALAYKLGELEIRKLRAQAAVKLGSRLDLRRFHDTVLGSGAVPLAVLGRIVEAWIRAEAAPVSSVPVVPSPVY